MSHTEYPIHVDQLVIGLYVRLELGDKKNPFRNDSFKIKSSKQIETIRLIGLEHVICILEKSDRMPLPPDKARSAGSGQGGAASEPSAPEGAKTPVSRELFGLKSETIERNKERRKRYRKVEKRYDKTMSSIVTILRRASGRSSEAAQQASAVVDNLVETFLSEQDTVLNLMSSKPSEEARNYHALNVTVLSMMVGKALKLGSETMHALGLGALFHDIGKGRVPMQAMSKGGAASMNAAAEKYYREHPIIGARLVQDFYEFPPLALQTVLQHHERMDGKGYPSKLPGKKVSPLARVVAVVNAYDNFLNDLRAEKTYTPHEALKQMYAMKAGFDSRVLSAFIKNIGVYPPGTVVKLSNGQYGMVTSTLPSKPARPTVLMYHPEIPKDEALMVDMVVEDELEVTKTLAPEDLPREIFVYLSPSRQINFYADTVPRN